MTTDNSQATQRYPSDLCDEEWYIIERLIQKLEPYETGRPREVDLREVLNAIFYLNKTGCPWRYLPTDFPHYKVVNYYYNKWTDNKLLERVNAELRENLREKKKQKTEPRRSNYR